MGPPEPLELAALPRTGMRFFFSGIRPRAVAIVSPLKLLELCRHCKRLATGGNKAARGSGRAAAAAGRHDARISRLAIVFAFVFL